jgi:hypothetical protein
VSRLHKPLIRPEVYRDRLRTFTLPPGIDAARRKLIAFARLVTSPDARRLGEENLRPGFLSDVFGELLGYRLPNTHPDDFTLVPEFALRAGRGFADAVIGRTPRDGRGAIVAIEVKGPTDPLDMPHAGRRLSAIEQGFDYAINLGCDWIIVTSMREIRLYYKGADRFTCERFEITQLATSESALRRFVYLLGAERVAPAHGRSHLYELLEASRIAGENITRTFYAEYSRLRSEAFVELSAANPAIDKVTVLRLTQKLLDRILFCAFAEDRGLLPPDTVKNALTFVDPYNPQPRWWVFQALFRGIDQGNALLRIPKYNGGLFAPDADFDAMTVPDKVCVAVARLSEFDFRAPDDADEDLGLPATTEGVVDVEVLGHIFEQSITDLERLRLELEGLIDPEPAKAKSKRKKEGAFYTPQYITRYIVEQTLGPTLSERLEALRQRHFDAAKAAARKVLENPTTYEADLLKPAQRDALIAFWTDWQTELGRLRILDPACGSGAFLIEAFDQLLAAYRKVNSRLEELRGAAEIFDLNRQILQQNLYGVDLNEEAAEICRLSLWIKTAEVGKILTDIDHTIRRGNSIVDNVQVHPLAFDWRSAFPEVFAEGGFDVVIGNPPYIRQEWLAPYKDFLKSRYAAYSGTADLYIYFVERGLDLLRTGGRLGFITSGTFARGNFAVPFRRWLPTTAKFTSLVNFGENQPFEDAEMVYPTIFTLQKTNGDAAGRFPTLFINDKIPSSLNDAMEKEGLLCDESVFDSDEWKFQPKEITSLFNEIMNAGRPLGDVVNGRMYRGILTGLNEAFIIDTPTRDELVRRDARSAELLRPILKGEDLRPWYQDWEGRWLVSTRRGVRIEDYPAIKAHLEQYRERLEPRPIDWKGSSDSWPGRKPGGYEWFEIQDSIAYIGEFDQPKILWPDIQKLPRFSWDADGMALGNTGYLAVSSNMYPLAALQSRAFWFQVSQSAQSLRLRGGLWQYRCIDGPMRPLRLPALAPADEAALSSLAEQATAIARERHQLHRTVRHRLTTDLATPGSRLNNALTDWWKLDFRTFREELQKAFKADLPVRERADWEASLAGWRGDHDRLTAALVATEEEINARVYHAFGLGADKIRLLEDFMHRTRILYPLGST